MRKLRRLADNTGADEIGITAWTHALEDRLCSLELLAQAHDTTGYLSQRESNRGYFSA